MSPKHNTTSCKNRHESPTFCPNGGNNKTPTPGPRQVPRRGAKSLFKHLSLPSWRHTIFEPRPFEALRAERAKLIEELQHLDSQARDLFGQLAALEETAVLTNMKKSERRHVRGQSMSVTKRIYETVQDEGLLQARLGELAVEIQCRERWCYLNRQCEFLREPPFATGRLAESSSYPLPSSTMLPAPPPLPWTFPQSTTTCDRFCHGPEPLHDFAPQHGQMDQQDTPHESGLEACNPYIPGVAAHFDTNLERIDEDNSQSDADDDMCLESVRGSSGKRNNSLPSLKFTWIDEHEKGDDHGHQCLGYNDKEE